MSIFRLATTTVQRMPPAAGGGARPQVVPPAGGVAPPPPGAPPAPAPVAQPPAPGAMGSAIAALTTFIPAETITLFVAVSGIIAGWKTSPSDHTQDGALVVSFFLFLALSPLFYVVATIIACRAQQKEFTITPRVIWRFIALMIAFVVW